MIGYRGCYRYVRQPDLFRLELDVLGRVLEETPNLRLMIPFVRTGWELEACLEVIDDSPVASVLPVWVMAEVPSVAYWIPEYAAMGIEGVSIGSNDLTQLMLGVNRDSAVCADLFDESDPAVLDAKPDHRRLAAGRDDVLTVRAGALQPPGVRGAPGPVRHHLNLGQPRRRDRGPPLHRHRGVALGRGGRPGRFGPPRTRQAAEKEATRSGHPRPAHRGRRASQVDSPPGGAGAHHPGRLRTGSSTREG